MTTPPRFIAALALCLPSVAGGADLWMDAAEMDRYAVPFDGFAAVRAVVDNRLGATDLTNVRFKIEIHSGTFGSSQGWMWDDPSNPWFGVRTQAAFLADGSSYTQGDVYYPPTQEWAPAFQIDRRNSLGVIDQRAPDLLDGTGRHRGVYEFDQQVVLPDPHSHYQLVVAAPIAAAVIDRVGDQFVDHQQQLLQVALREPLISHARTQVLAQAAAGAMLRNHAEVSDEAHPPTSTSSDRSNACTECVKAPTEIRSTPASA